MLGALNQHLFKSNARFALSPAITAKGKQSLKINCLGHLWRPPYSMSLCYSELTSVAGNLYLVQTENSISFFQWVKMTLQLRNMILQLFLMNTTSSLKTQKSPFNSTFQVWLSNFITISLISQKGMRGTDNSECNRLVQVNLVGKG